MNILKLSFLACLMIFTVALFSNCGGGEILLGANDSSGGAIVSGGGDDDGGGETCGNGIVESPEECDGVTLGGATCASLGFASGELSCNAGCKFETDRCKLLCGAAAGFELFTEAGVATDEIFVADRAKQPDQVTSGRIRVRESGYYEIYNTADQSRMSDLNESGFITVSNRENLSGLPLAEDANCSIDGGLIGEHAEYSAVSGDVVMVQDADNDPLFAPPLNLYYGTFKLLRKCTTDKPTSADDPCIEDDNLLTLYHYCPVYRANQCTEFHLQDTLNTPPVENCDYVPGAGDPARSFNSLHFFATACIRRLPDKR